MARKKTTRKKPKASNKAPAKKKTTSKDARAKDKDELAKAAVDRGGSAKKRVAAAKKAVERSKNYAAAGLAAQVTETLLDEMRAMDKLWHQTPEAQQAVVIARLSDRVYNAMGQATRILAAQGHPAVICNLFEVKFKEGVRAVVTVAPGSDVRHQLADHATKDVVLVLTDPGQFMQGLEDIKPDADQPKLI